MTFRSLFILFSLSLTCPAGHAAVLRVGPGLPDTPRDGGTWATAYTSVQAAIAAAAPGDEVWTAAGTYRERIVLRNAVSLYGGFSGAEIRRDARDPVANETILDGNKQDSVVTAPSGVSADTVVDGFTIQNGSGAGIGGPYGYGGGILCSGGSPTISRNVIQDNASIVGGAVACVSGAHPTIADNLLRRNSVLPDSGGRRDGAIIELYSSPALIVRNVFRENGRLDKPRALIYSYGNATIAGNLIVGNVALGSIVEGAAGNLTVIGNTIVDNACGPYGAMNNAGSGLIANNIVAWNTAGVGSVKGQFRNNCVWRNGGSDYVSGPDRTDTYGNIKSDPRFSDRARLAYHIQPDSPCVDVGSDADASMSLDIDGQPRVIGAHVDIGADESDGTVWPERPRLLHVRPDGDDQNDGGSWERAMRSVLTALDSAGPGCEVWVAEGAYVGSGTVRAGVALYGGFAGREASRAERDPMAHRVELTTYGAGTVLVVPPAGAETRPAVIDGFHIRGGRATSADAGGIAVRDAAVIIAHNRLTGNAGHPGGAISCIGSPSLDISDNEIVENTTFSTDYRYNGSGAGIYLEGVSGTVSRNVISDNHGLGSFGASGGGIFCSGSTIVISENRISRNGKQEPPTSSYYSFGGGIYCVDGDARIVNNDIRGNLSVSGAGIYARAAVVAGNTLVANNSSAAGGGLFLIGGSAINNTVVGNTARSAGGISVETLAPSKLAAVANNIIAFNSSGIVASYQGSDLTLTHNCFYANGDSDVANTGDPVGTNGNIRRDPLLASLAWGDVHIQPDSPCRDAGDASVLGELAMDLDAEPRIQGNGVDIGADESTGTLWSVTPRIVRVRSGGDDAADGSSWESAMRTPTAGLEALKDSGGEVWVAEGQYAPLRIGPFTYVYGGFAGTETEREQRNWGRHPTVLDGAGAQTVVTLTAGLRTSVLDGFTVRGGLSTGYGAAGVTALGSAAPIIAHNIIRDNVARPTDETSYYLTGGLFIAGDALVASNTILGNSGSGVGGVTSLAQHPVFRNNTVIGNSGTAAGGLHIEFTADAFAQPTSTVPLLENNLIAYNTSGLQIRPAFPSVGPILRNNNIFGNGEQDVIGLKKPVGSLGNIAADPQIVNVPYGGFHLTETSPCRDAGTLWAGANTERDIDGKLRVQGSRVDIGADEYGDPAPTITPRIVRVVWARGNTGNGSNWSTAVGSIQRAIELASPGGEVWVASGTYFERIALRPYVYLYSGFNGDETQREQRPTLFNPAVLDAGQAGPVVTATGVGVYAGLDGFIIRNGRSNDFGGGIACVVSSPTITNNRIMSNRAVEGGGISARWSSPRIAGNDISYNTADVGGGIAVSNGSQIVIERNTIVSNNGAIRGGGLAGDRSTIILRNNLFARNAGETGGAISIPGNYSSVTITNNTIAHNLSLRNGSATVVTNSTSVVVNNIVAFNSAGLPFPPGAGNYVYGNLDFDYPGQPTRDLLDPLFVTRSGGYYQLDPSSPAIDIGDDAVVPPGDSDLGGNARIQGLRVDMGAYEYGAIGARFQDVVDALRISGGLDGLTPDDKARLNVVPDGASTDAVDIFDAIRLLRRSMGTDTGP